jgi:hypothetical protein
LKIGRERRDITERVRREDNEETARTERRERHGKGGGEEENGRLWNRKKGGRRATVRPCGVNRFFYSLEREIAKKRDPLKRGACRSSRSSSRKRVGIFTLRSHCCIISNVRLT